MTGELGNFLRSRREAVRPEDVGLAAGSRRRTPGLRRAELATLAGISVEYLVRLEQGRDTRPSVQVLAALATALRMDDADRDHLQQLATVSQGTELCTQGGVSAARHVRSPVRTLLDRLDPAPAVVVNHLLDVLAWNSAYDRLSRPLGLLDGEVPNLLWYTATDARAREAYPDWSEVLDEQVAFLHGFRRGDPATDALAERISTVAGSTFSDRWKQRPLAQRRSRVTAIAHPDVGALRLVLEPLELTDGDYQRLVVHLPADTASAERLDRLAGRRPGALRSVSS
ncbi:helix-turn-helix transcriptional regulator [Blastococcus xanthinilyticus]|uniref:Helix-turn-helix protein n=1 Tax=Blastococcus xanthinilyticus TaxID=1564164 RepID=A0A5S5CYP2_9ACTN|nr:helix-turn-helix transcriptional regulator [Blastococcus xanthinilyticus]TYP88128.1 helix-turn-helix protein [Blastococcus xanthinilyticus]